MRMRHPNLPAEQVVEVSSDAFAAVWRDRGWVDADAEDAPSEPVKSDPKPARRGDKKEI